MENGIEIRNIGKNEIPFAVADFRRHGIGYGGELFDEIVHCKLLKSRCTDYGNGTCMVFSYSTKGVLDDIFDTRYEKVSPKNFKEFARKVLTDRTIEGAIIEEL